MTADGPTASTSRTWTRRNDGCLTCRKRRVRCPRDKPECENCRRLDLQCTYPPEGGTRRRRRRSKATSQADTQNDFSSYAPLGITGVNANNSVSSQTTISELEPVLFQQSVPSPVNENSSSSNNNNMWGAEMESFRMALEQTDMSQSPFTFSNDILDANLCFDLFSSSFQADVDAVMESQSVVPIVDPPDQAYRDSSKVIRHPVTPLARDQPILAHFVESVSQAATVRNPTSPNHYISLHAASLFYAPLYAGVLAWSAWHMAMTCGHLQDPKRMELLAYAEQRHQACGADLFNGLDTLASHQDLSTACHDFEFVADAEAVYCGVMVYCQYEIVTASPPARLCDHLERIGNSLGGFGQFVRDCKSPLVQRMATILAAFDVRSAMFASRIPRYALRLGAAFFDPSPLQMVSGNLASLQLHYFEAKCIEQEVALTCARGSENTMEVRMAMRTGDLLYERIIGLEPAFDSVILDALSDVSLDDDRDETGPNHSLGPYLACDLFLACWYNALVIYICRILNYPAPRRAINRIVGAARSLLKTSPASPHIALAKPLFFAGLETRDDRQVEWIYAKLATPSAAGWGPAQKTGELLREIRAVEKEGAKKHLGEIAQQEKFNFIV